MSSFKKILVPLLCLLGSSIVTFSLTSLHHDREEVKHLETQYNAQILPLNIMQSMLYEFKDISYRMTAYLGKVHSAPFCFNKLNYSTERLNYLNGRLIELTNNIKNVELQKKIVEVTDAYRSKEPLLEKLRTAYREKNPEAVSSFYINDWPLFLEHIYRPLSSANALLKGSWKKDLENNLLQKTKLLIIEECPPPCWRPSRM